MHIVDGDGDVSCLHCGHAPAHDYGEMHHSDDRAYPVEWGPLGTA